MSVTASPAGDSGNPLDSVVRELLARIQALETAVYRAQSLFGRQIFLADTSAGDGTWQVVYPDGGSNVVNIDGFFGGGSNAADCPLLDLGPGIEAIVPFRTGENTAYFPIRGFRLHSGIVTVAAECAESFTVHEIDPTSGDELTGDDVTVYHTSSSCSPAGMCLGVGDVIVYMIDAATGLAYMVGGYKRLSIGYYACGTTSAAVADDLTTLRVYPGDFHLMLEEDCHTEEGDPIGTNRASLFWRGNVVKAYNITGNDCGKPPGVPDSGGYGTGGVKVFDFDTALGQTFGTSAARIAFSVQCGTTTASSPIVDGSPCTDASLPLQATIQGAFPTGITIDASGTMTATLNTNTCTITFNPPTMKCLIPWT